MSRVPRSHRNHVDESNQNIPARGRIPSSSFGPFREILSRESAPVAEKTSVSGAAGVHSPATRKSNVSSACTPCRRLKTKCDGRSPCSNCTSKNTEEACTYDVDNRRKGVLKRMLHDSQQENTQLQSILEYLRSASAEAAAALLGRIRQGLNTEELIKYMESIPATSVTASPRPNTPSETPIHQGMTDLPVRSSTSWTSVTHDQEKVKHLVDLYFCWQHHYIRILSKSEFVEAMQRGNDRFCSPVLVNAILAAGSLLYEPHDQRETQQDVKVLGDRFMEDADRLIQEELIQGRCSLTSVQALVIMSMRDIAAGKEAIMWFHLGLAVMMAINLALDTDAGHGVSPNREAERTTYWGLFVADRLAAFISGRLPQMRTVSRPGKPQDRSIEDDIWSPIMGMASDPNFSRPENFAQVISFQYEFFEIIDDMQSLFYLPGRNAKSNEINALYVRLLQWRDRQPAEMDPAPFAVPNVFHLRLLYHAAVLVLFRPYLHSPTEVLSAQPTIARKDAAAGILHVVTIYNQCYGLRYAPMFYLNHIYAAALVHVAELSDPQTLRLFLQCIRCIKTMGKFFKRPAEMAFTAMLSMLSEHDIKLPRRIREEFTGVISLDPFEGLFVEQFLEPTGRQPFLIPGLASPGRPVRFADGHQEARSESPGSVPFSENRETPVEDFLVGELAFGSGLLPDLLEDDNDDSLGRRW